MVRNLFFIASTSNALFLSRNHRSTNSCKILHGVRLVMNMLLQGHVACVIEKGKGKKYPSKLPSKCSQDPRSTPDSMPGVAHGSLVGVGLQLGPNVLGPLSLTQLNFDSSMDK